MTIQEMTTALENLKSQQARVEKEHQERRDYRWNNYINCVDDYSVGGIQDQIEARERSSIQSLINIMEQQIDNGGHIERTIDTLELRDLETGKVLSRKCIPTKFGEAFIIEHKGGAVTWVSLAKKQETFAKKGYQCVTVSHKLHLVYDGTQNSKFSNRTVTLVETTERVEDRPGAEGWDNGSLELWLLSKNSTVTQQKS